ncbi:MAG: 5-(carboxyamino)imidazole ribonucleotide synthase [Anaerolineales bacterium]|nr:5-(carboxyamino)imidazole ribonucleotide synthase [Anaerolineales bacterium]MCX7755987.1 5-(carboxyamino)imidazole ribonucleotide synthase [Anaerolineales bacterium]MDW8277069.1 5-(carboxyamino)imidazole ribonucleotide synthase [Anaerolineales bacterium]
MTTLGILGAGQLGRMLALAGYPLGMRFRFFDPAPDAPAKLLADHLTADYGDTDALRRFADGVDVITYEFENVPVETARFLQQFCPVYPPPMALEKGQDRLVEKNFFRALGIPTPDFAAISTETDLEPAAALTGFPAVLKTRRMGYDGKGQFTVWNREELAEAFRALNGQPAILEQFIPFERELSILGVRGRDGEIVFYPLTENTHREGILRLSVAPAPRRPQTSQLLAYRQSTQSLAEMYATALMTALDYVGVLAIELFQAGDRLLANEMAPRVHNSGHWTLQGAVTSQFENHVRAVMGLPLGSTNPLGVTAMVNLIGQIPPLESILKIEGAHLHLYDKAPRPGRKVGHINLTARTHDELLSKAEIIRKLVDG